MKYRAIIGGRTYMGTKKQLMNVLDFRTWSMIEDCIHRMGKYRGIVENYNGVNCQVDKL